MKKYIFFFVAIAFSLSFSTCNENMPEIACLSCPDGPGGPIPPQARRVMVEEFTGVRCINCPGGSVEIENLLNIHGERLIAVSIHAEFFANPYPENMFDFRTPEGEFIINFLGLPEAYPAAVIDRKQFSGESDLQLVGSGAWAGKIGQQLEETAKVSLELDNTYDAASRLLTVNLAGQAIESVNEEVRFTVMITESGIVDAQLTPESSPGKDLDYVHKHVLRKILTAFDGNVISPSIAAGESFNETVSFTIPDEWAVANCEVIAFAHLAESSKEILQATEAHLAD